MPYITLRGQNNINTWVTMILETINGKQEIQVRRDIIIPDLNRISLILLDKMNTREEWCRAMDNLRTNLSYGGMLKVHDALITHDARLGVTIVEATSSQLEIITEVTC